MQLANVTLPIPLIQALCERYEVDELSLFGSATRDDFHAESDLDSLVRFKPGAVVGLIRFESLRLDLEDLLGRRVDLVPRDGLKARIRKQVLAGSRVVYAG